MCRVKEIEHIKPVEDSDEENDVESVSTCPILEADFIIRLNAELFLSFILHMAFEAQFISESIKYRLTLLQWKREYFIRLLNDMKDIELFNLMNVLGDKYVANKENHHVLYDKIFSDIWQHFDKIHVTIERKTVAVSIYKSVAKELFSRQQFYNMEDVKEVCEMECKTINDLWERFECRFKTCHKLIFYNNYTSDELIVDIVKLVKE